jgi:sialate O-acetylesterase
MTRRIPIIALFSLMVLVSPAALRAGVKVHGLFCDSAVVQRGVRLPIWGTADALAKVTVSFAGQEATAEPKDGAWRVELPPLPAGGPHTLTISQENDKIEVKDVLVGEVWICGGQSNMEFPVQASDVAKEAIEASANDKIRLFTVPRRGAPMPETDVSRAGATRSGRETSPSSWCSSRRS